MWRVLRIEHDADMTGAPRNKNEMIVHFVLERELLNGVLRVSRFHRLNDGVFGLRARRFWVVSARDDEQAS